MFPRKKKNRTGTISVVVVDKSRGGFKEVKSFGVAKTEEEADRLYAEASEWIRRFGGQQEIAIEMHIDSINENDVVLIHDDLLATGGTAMAAYKLVQHFHPKKVYVNFIIEITDEGLHGRDLFKDIELSTLMTI